MLTQHNAIHKSRHYAARRHKTQSQLHRLLNKNCWVFTCSSVKWDWYLCLPVGNNEARQVKHLAWCLLGNKDIKKYLLIVISFHFKNVCAGVRYDEDTCTCQNFQSDVDVNFPLDGNFHPFPISEKDRPHLKMKHRIHIKHPARNLAHANCSRCTTINYFISITFSNEKKMSNT